MPHIPGHVANTAVGPGQLLNPALPTGTTLPPQQQVAQPNFAAAPQTGLIGSEQALQGALRGSLGALQGGLNQGRADLLGGQAQGMQQLGAGIGDLRQAQQQGLGLIEGAIGQGVAPLQGFVDPGQQAQNRLSALLGVGGQQAFDDAFLNDPAQQFLRQQGSRRTLSEAAATGGLGGGRVKEELNRQNIGLAAQDLANQRAGLSGLAGQGLQAAGQIGGLRGQQAGLSSGLVSNLAQARGQLFGQGADLAGRTGQQLGQQAFQGGQLGANLISGTGQLVSGGRTRAGEQLAGQIGGTTSALSDLINRQGIGLSDLTGTSSGNLANILQGSGNLTGATLGNLAQLLSGGQGQLGGNIAGLLGGSVPGAQQTQGNLGGLGQLASGIGTALPALAALSDIRLKENLELVGTTEGGHNLYTWDWNAEGKQLAGDQVGYGVIAQEAAAVEPGSVIKGEHGYLMVDYGRIH